jgi:phosphosulfolactate phosphohydrolase-like enzyme
MLKDLIPQNILSEESVNAIEKAFADKLNIHTEAALAKQDELYASKLQSLLEAINSDHSKKLVKVVEAIDKNNSVKLINIVKKYETELTKSASNFKEQLVESISQYLEIAIDDVIPAGAIEEATKNKQALAVLEGLRKTLAVDSALMKESIKEAVVEGKHQIDEAYQKASSLEAENNKLKKQISEMKKAVFIESKASKMPATKQEYIKKVLSDKDYKFVVENFDYVSKLFDKREAEQVETIKEQAFASRTVKADAPKIISEKKVQKDPLLNSYINQLGRFK